MIDISKLHEDILVIADSFHEFCCKSAICGEMRDHPAGPDSEQS